MNINVLIFLENEMSFDVIQLKNDIKNKPKLCTYVEYLVNLMINEGINKNTKNNKVCNPVGDKILNIFEVNTLGMNEDCHDYIYYDNLRHAFSTFSRGGLEGLWRGIEISENWYPKVLITKPFGQIGNINELPAGQFDIYRGTSVEELSSENFRQSWSLDKDIAKEFAYIHGADYENRSGTTRCVLTAKISRHHVFWTGKLSYEKEVVVDTSKLENIKKLCSKKI